MPTAEKNQIAASYHYTGPRGIAYLEFDHRVPFKLCGSNLADNVWPEVFDDVPRSLYVHNRKDQLEAKVYALIRSHRLTFAQGQQLYEQPNDWRAMWCHGTVGTVSVAVHKSGDGVTCDV